MAAIFRLATQLICGVCIIGDITISAWTYMYMYNLNYFDMWLIKL